MTTCRNCDGQAILAFRKLVLRRHDVGYFRCLSCGFLQTDLPNWLAEAYGTDPVSPYDIGSPWRAIRCAGMVARLINEQFDPRGSFIDYGGGTGLFVRLMRDHGFDFYRHDPYCPNIYARFFDWSDSKTESDAADLVTCFEVFEHFVDPRAELARIAALSDTIFLTTCLQPPAEDLPNWQYLVPECGQHVAFHTEESLRRLASQFGYRLVTDGCATHVLSKRALEFDPGHYFSPSLNRLSLFGRMVRKVSRLLEPRIFDPPQSFPYPPEKDAAWVNRCMALPRGPDRDQLLPCSSAR